MDDKLSEQLPAHLAGYKRLVDFMYDALRRTPEPRPGFWSDAFAVNDVRLRPKGERLEIIVGGHLLCEGPLSLVAGVPPLFADPGAQN